MFIVHHLLGADAITEYMIKMDIKYLLIKYTVEEWRLSGNVEEKDELYIFTLCHVDETDKCNKITTT